MSTISKLSHIAINADDLAAARAFYHATFGWQFSPWGPPGFFRIDGDHPHGPGVTTALQQRRALLDDQRTTGFECTFSSMPSTRSYARR